MASPMGMMSSFGAALKPGAAPAKPDPGADDSDALLVPAQDLIDAVKKGDPKQVAEAMRACNRVCMDEYDTDQGDAGAPGGGEGA
jgi:hypothetical protein